MLRDCLPGRELRLCGLAVTGRERLRLAELGFVAGARIRVIGKGPAGGLVVAVDDARVALDGAMVKALIVQPTR